MLEFIEAIDKEVPVDDSTSLGEKMFLYGFIRAVEPKVCVETGTHKGLTSLYMLHALFDNGKGHLTTYDPFEWGARGNFRKFPELEKIVTYVQGAGKDMTEEAIDFAFIDGFHEKYIVLDEINAILPRLNKNAVVVFHDCDDEPENNEKGANAAIASAGLKNLYLVSKNRMRVYVKD